MAGTYIVCFCCAQKMCLLAKIAVITTHSLVCILDIYIMLVCACIPASRRNTRFLPVTNHWIICTYATSFVKQTVFMHIYLYYACNVADSHNVLILDFEAFA